MLPDDLHDQHNIYGPWITGMDSFRLSRLWPLHQGFNGRRITGLKKLEWSMRIMKTRDFSINKFPPMPLLQFFSKMKSPRIYFLPY